MTYPNTKSIKKHVKKAVKQTKKELIKLATVITCPPVRL